MHADLPKKTDNKGKYNQQGRTQEQAFIDFIKAALPENVIHEEIKNTGYQQWENPFLLIIHVEGLNESALIQDEYKNDRKNEGAEKDGPDQHMFGLCRHQHGNVAVQAENEQDGVRWDEQRLEKD